MMWRYDKKTQQWVSGEIKLCRSSKTFAEVIAEIEMMDNVQNFRN